MQITNILIKNYKNFYAPAEINLSSGLTVVTGQNGAGKTTLLEALNLNFEPRPNESLDTRPEKTSQPEPVSSISVTVHLSRKELLEIMKRQGISYIALPSDSSPLAKQLEIQEWNPKQVRVFIDWFFSRDAFSFRLQRVAGGGNPEWRPQGFASHGLFEPTRNDPKVPHVNISISRDDTFAIEVATRSTVDDLGVQIVPQLIERIYRFYAERSIRAISAQGNNKTLAVNGANLAEVLGMLQPNPASFDEFNRLVTEVLPQVKHISVKPAGGGQSEIMVWHFDRSLGRDDLAISLGQTGSGIGQVLALLYVVYTSEYPRLFLIDEPQSFLHPGAARKLMEIFARYPQHQFVITTHSPTIIAAARPKTFLVLTGTQETQCQVINGEAADALQLSLNELGVRLSDVFGADNVLWVEGPTEESCFPLILRRFKNRSLMGTAVIGVRQTGDLEGRDAERVFEIYAGLSASNILLPPAIGFIFDRENKTAQQQKELIRRSKGRLSFLPRRMYENYLLHPGAIADLINFYDSTREQPVVAEAVDRFLIDAHINPIYFSGVPDQQTWMTDITGADVLRDCLSTLTDTRMHYDKVTHGYHLTKWILDNSPDDLIDLGDLIENRLQE